MKFELNEYGKNIADWELIEDVIAVAKKTGKGTVTQCEYQQHGNYHRGTLRRRFGSWFATLKKAGLEPLKGPRNTEAVNDEALFNNIAEVWIKLGRQPRRKDMHYPVSRFSYGAYVRHFGTWMKALRKFVEYANTEPVGGIEGENEIMATPDGAVARQECLKKCEPVGRDTRNVSLRLKFGVFLRDGFRCVACGRSPLREQGVKLQCDHVDPWSRGGKTIMDNLQTLCEECNLGKGDMRM